MKHSRTRLAAWLLACHVLLIALPLAASNVSTGKQPSNIILILVDTLRADHLGCYGYDRETSPRIDQAAAEGVLFQRLYSVCSWTDPTIVSLFTGRYPQAVWQPLRHREAIKQTVPTEIDTLAEILQTGGFSTLAVVDHPGISTKRNFSQGFDEFVDPHQESGWHDWIGTDPHAVLSAVRKLLSTHRDRRFFLYVHVVWPHVPYTPKAGFKDLFGKGHTKVEEVQKQSVINDYDAEIRMTDVFIGDVMDTLEASSLRKKSYVIITSDHGEGFWEHGLHEHGNSLFNEVLHVPLIICPPSASKQQPRVVPDLLSNIDLFPTVLDLAGIKPPPDTDGRSLLPIMAGHRERGEPTIFSESAHSKIIHGFACRKGDHKLIYAVRKPAADIDQMRRDMVAGRHVLTYDILNDPGESTSLRLTPNEAMAEIIAELVNHKALNDRRRESLDARTRPVDPEVQKKLRALGYID